MRMKMTILQIVKVNYLYYRIQGVVGVENFLKSLHYGNLRNGEKDKKCEEILEKSTL